MASKFRGIVLIIAMTTLCLNYGTSAVEIVSEIRPEVIEKLIHEKDAELVAADDHLTAPGNPIPQDSRSNQADIDGEQYKEDPLLTENETMDPNLHASAADNSLEMSDDKRKRHGKFFGGSYRFGFMKWVNIPADECPSNRDNTTGICTSYKDCKVTNGSIEGSCFGGFGACCVYRRSCGDALTAKVGYFESPGDFANAGAPCILHVQKYDLSFTGMGKRKKRQASGLGGMQSSICQFKIEFTQMVLAQPTNQSICETDVFVVSGTTTRNPPPICGTNTDQHMYLDMDGTNSPARLTIVRNGQFSGRNFKIKITQIECWSPERAPRGCLQYYTGIAGQIRSFNFFFPTDKDSVRQLANQDYEMCIRQAEGFCSTCFTQCPDTQNSSPATASLSFSLSSPSSGLARATSGDGAGKCKSDWLAISCATNGTDLSNPFATCADRFCGELFGLDQATNPGRLCTTDTTIRYMTDDSESDAAQESATGKKDQGFCLTYTQQTCG